MNLHTRILLGYGYLVTLLLISAVGAALGFHQLGSNLGTVLSENFESVRSSMLMLEALERQDSAVLGSLFEEDDSRELLEKSEASFLEALAQAGSNVTLPQEGDLVREIGRSFEDYRRARDRLLQDRPERPLRAYETETYPRFEIVKRKVLALLDANHAAMVEADRGAQREATVRAVLHGLLVVVALLSLSFLSRAMRRNIFARLADFRAVAEAIAAGDHRRRAAVDAQDELGVIARQLNVILDEHQQLENVMQGRLNVQRQLVLGLLRARDRRAAVLSRDGQVVASTLDEPDTRAVAEAAARLPEPDAAAPSLTREAAGARSVTFSPLATPAGRPVGWLATVAGSGGAR